MDRFAFRPVTRADLPMLGDWLRQPLVAGWWLDADRQLAGIAEDLDDTAMQQWIVLHHGAAIAYAQNYPAHGWQAPHFAHLPPRCHRHRLLCRPGPAGLGLGGGWLSALAGDLLQRATVLAIDPQPDNLRAIRACEKAGFQGDLLCPDEYAIMARVMTRHR